VLAEDLEIIAVVQVIGHWARLLFVFLYLPAAR
jgi:hypothetical protein